MVLAHGGGLAIVAATVGIGFIMLVCQSCGFILAGSLFSQDFGLLGRNLAAVPATWLLGTVLLLPVLRTTLYHAAAVSMLGITLFAVPAVLVYWLVLLFLG